MLKKLKQSNQGFTIIEVLIVLAIAALILLIVFLAVPALQRQQRNTGRKSEAARASASVVDFISNNNGGLPTTQPNCQTIVNSWGFGTTSQYSTLTGNVCPVANVTNTLRIAVGSIVANNVYLYNGAGGATGTVAAAQSQVMYIVDNSTCNGNDTVQPGTVGRSVAFLYTLEAGNGNSWACITANG